MSRQAGGRAPSSHRVAHLLHHLRPGLPEHSRETSESLGAQVALSSTGMVLAGAVRFAYTVLIGLVFGSVAVGQVNSGISLALFVSLLYPSASALAVTKFLARSRGAGDLDEADAVTRYLLRVTYLTAGLLAVGTFVLTPGLLHTSWTGALSVAALVIANSGYLFARSLLFGAGRVVRATVWDFATTLLSLVLLGAVLLAGMPSVLLLPLTIGYAVYALANAPRRRGGRPEAPLRREMLSFIHISLLNSIATSGVLQLSMVAAQHWDPAQAGSFAAALALATPASLVSRSVSSVLFPNLASLHGRGDAEGARTQVDVLTRSLLVISVAIFGTLMIVSPLLISIFFPKPAFAPAAAVLPVMLAAVMIQNMVVASTNMQMTRSQAGARGVMLASMGGAVVAVGSWLVFAPTGGYQAVAWGFLASAVVASAIPTIATWRTDRMKWLVPFLRVGLGTAAAAAASAWTLRNHIGPLLQVAAALVFLAAWLLLSWRDTLGVLQVVRRRR